MEFYNDQAVFVIVIINIIIFVQSWLHKTIHCMVDFYDDQAVIVMVNANIMISLFSCDFKKQSIAWCR